ncbi:MAG: hypothetical protein WCW02_00335 [Candidatus Buchananbacteria bacterium]
MPQLCPELTTKLAPLKQLKQEFDLELTKAQSLSPNKPEDLVLVREAKIKLEQASQAFQDLQNELWLETPELTPENLKAQYEAQVDILRKNNLLKTLSTGELGIEAIDKREYPIPTLEQIEFFILKNKEFLKTKIPQGFVKLIIVPFGLPISSLIEAYSKALIECHKQGCLYDAQFLHFEFNAKPIHDYTGWVKAEATGELVYFPKEYSKTTHQGKTKQELLPTQAWQILMLEDSPDIPDKGKGKTVNGRQQPEANQSPNDYLKQLQTNLQYKGEQGLTPESWLVYGLDYLKEGRQIIDSRQDYYRGCIMVNSYFKETGYVPTAYPGHGDMSVTLDRKSPNDSWTIGATRFAVSIL